VLKAEGFVTDEASEVEELKPVYCSNCNEANIKLARGDLCSAVWKKIDPERSFEGILDFPFCMREPPFYWMMEISSASAI
jgi:hypothetical protein